MTAALRRGLIVLSLVCLTIAPAFSQADQPSSGFGFKLGMGIGVQTFNDTNPPTTWQSLSFLPDISFGKLGIGFDVTLNYNFSGPNNSLTIRQADWWPTGSVTFQGVLGIYLPKIAYIRWGVKGDPLFLKLGSFNDATLGDGFIMGDYNNMLFLPTDRHFGFQADMDGALFDFPYVGVETTVGNLAQLDVLGARLYVRPLVKTTIPILNALQIGVVAAVDTNPYFKTASSQTGTASPVGVFGVGALAPVIYQKDVFSMLAFADAATAAASGGTMRWGGMAGVGGRIINIFTYGAQLRLLGAGFTPTYFGPAYDAQRDLQYNSVLNPSGTGATFGGLVSLGTSLLGDALIFKVTLEVPFISGESDPMLSKPHLNGILSLAPGVLPVFSFDCIYDKKAIQGIDLNDTVIQAKLNLQSGPAVISFIYYITPQLGQSPPWTVTSGLQSSIALF